MTGGARPLRQPGSRTPIGTATIGDDLSTMYFPPLAGTAAEARAINALFPEAVLLTGRSATKAAVERLESPGILHIASHGFFLPRQAENPLLRSGLALAGANLKHGPPDDGILTALEASALNLRGTKLVTLSACDSGIGESATARGFGLRRAFVLAGAETLVTTLWPVSDASSREAMAAARRAQSGPGAWRRAAAGQARDAEADRPSASVLLGQLHPVWRVGQPGWQALIVPRQFRRCSPQSCSARNSFAVPSYEVSKAAAVSRNTSVPGAGSGTHPRRSCTTHHRSAWPRHIRPPAAARQPRRVVRAWRSGNVRKNVPRPQTAGRR